MEQMKLEKGFSLVVPLVMVAVTITAGLIVWRLSSINNSDPTFSTSTKTETSNPENSPAQTPTKEWVVIEKWGVKIPASPSYEVAIGGQFSGPSYGNKQDESVQLYLPQFNNKFACETTDQTEVNKAIFATLISYPDSITLSGPYQSDKVVQFQNKNYALIKAGFNCYQPQDLQEITTFYNSYIQHFEVEGM